MAMYFYKIKKKYYFAAALSLLSLYAFANYAIAQYPGFSDPGTASAGNGTGLVAVSTTVDGGQIPTGATGQVVVRFRNDGGQAVQTGLIRLYPSSTVSAAVTLNQCEEEPLPSGAECAIALSVKGLQPGSWRVEMLMSHSGRTRLVTATLSGTVETNGDTGGDLSTDIEVLPNRIDFGSLASAQTLVQPVVMKNITSAPVKINEIYVDAGDQAGYSLETECSELLPGQACIAIMTWSPKLRGRSSGVIVVKHDGPSALVSIPLSGEYQPQTAAPAEVFPQAVPGKGLLVASQTQIDFGANVETVSTMTLSLVNAGDAALAIENIQLAGADSGLNFKNNGCSEGMILEPIEACPLTVSWSPTRVGALVDDIQVKHTGARGVLVLPIRGASSAAVSPDQKAIVLSSPQNLVVDTQVTARDIEDIIGDETVAKPTPRSSNTVQNPASVLDGYKITSFSPSRAIINGPGGSRLVFDQEEIVLGGIPWFVVIQESGIQFLYNGQRILLLFDRSLSSINRISSSSVSGVPTSASAPISDVTEIQ